MSTHRDRIKLPEAGIIRVAITRKYLRPATGCLRL
jgi:hypothetical protein